MSEGLSLFCLWISAWMGLASYNEHLITPTPTSLHPSLHPQLRHHPESLCSGRCWQQDEMEKERWCQFSTLLMIKKGVIWCLLLSCIKTAVSKCSPIKCHSCSLRVYNRVGWAVSQYGDCQRIEVCCPLPSPKSHPLCSEDLKVSCRINESPILTKEY